MEERVLVVEVSRDVNDPFHVEDGIDDFDAVEVSDRPGEVQRVRLVDYDAGHVLRLKTTSLEYVYDETTRSLAEKGKEGDGETIED